MTPETDHILLNAIGTLATGIAPEVETAFGQGQISLLSALLYFSALDFDRAADTRARENRDMRHLFAEAAEAEVGLDEQLRDELRKAGEEADRDLKISTLNAANARLKNLLIRLHEVVEGAENPAARAVEERIWELLRMSAAARALVLPELG